MDPILHLVERSSGIIDPTSRIHGHVWSWRPPPPPAPAGWAGAAPAECWGWGGGWRRPVKVTDSRGRRPGEPTSSGHWQTAQTIEDQEGNMSGRNLRKLTAAEAARLARLSYSVDLCWPMEPKLLTLGQIWYLFVERAFQELWNAFFSFILGIMVRALDRSKLRSVISPKIVISFRFNLVWSGKYWPKVTKIAHHKIHWRAFTPTKFRDSSSYLFIYLDIQRRPRDIQWPLPSRW